jgi:hypothetical protein
VSWRVQKIVIGDEEIRPLSGDFIDITFFVDSL